MGIPFGFHVTSESKHIENAFIHASWQWTGWKPGVVARHREERLSVRRPSYGKTTDSGASSK